MGYKWILNNINGIKPSGLVVDIKYQKLRLSFDENNCLDTYFYGTYGVRDINTGKIMDNMSLDWIYQNREEILGVELRGERLFLVCVSEYVIELGKYIDVVDEPEYSISSNYNNYWSMYLPMDSIVSNFCLIDVSDVAATLKVRTVPELIALFFSEDYIHYTIDIGCGNRYTYEITHICEFKKLLVKYTMLGVLNANIK